MSDSTRAQRAVSPAEWRWVAVASLLVMALLSVPYAVALWKTPAGMSFGGHLIGVEDMYSYLAKMRYGAWDGWLFRLVYTTEPHDGGLIFVQYVALGKLAAALTGRGARVSTAHLTIAFHAMRVIGGVILLAVVYRFAADMLPAPGQRRLAWALIALSSGLGWIRLVWPHLIPASVAGPLPVAMFIPEAFSVLILYMLPHVVLARAALLGGWLILFRAVDASSFPHAAITGLLWAIMTVMVPFYGALLGVLIALWLILLTVQRRALPWGVIRLAAVGGTPAAGLLVAYGMLFARNPVFAVWSVQNQLHSPPLPGYVLAYGLYGIIGALGAARLLRGRLSHRHVLLIGWPLAAMILVYIPVGVQRRLIEGVIVPLSVLAALGAHRIVEGTSRHGGILSSRRLRWMAVAFTLALLFPMTAILLAGGTATAFNMDWPLVHPADEMAALDWLRDEVPPGSAVLATMASGNVLPAYANIRVYVGHGPETIDERRKAGEARAFFLGGMSNRRRRALLSEAGIDYVWIGPPERNPCDGCFDPVALGLREVFQQGDYTIYQVIDP